MEFLYLVASLTDQLGLIENAPSVVVYLPLSLKMSLGGRNQAPKLKFMLYWRSFSNYIYSDV